MAKRRAGILDEFKQREICAIVAVGGSRRTAAKYVGCDPSTIRGTASRNEQFAQMLKRAESDLEIIHLSNIQQAAKKSWQASAWVLERVYPERFGKRAPSTISVDQLKETIAGVIDLIKAELRASPRRQRILRKLRAYFATLGKEPGAKEAT
ncbi:MAG: hypothetical protein HYX69_16985 [Planctomycetia bacterium]|nr:hypothetical protein [Planctomycetia bacterium]